MRSTLLLLLIAFFVAHAAIAQAPAAATPVAPSFRVVRATSKIVVDARLDEQAWRDASVIPIAYEWFPGDNVRPPVETEARVTFDESNIYVSFRALDPRPREIRANLMDRDSIETFVQDDHVTVMIDPFNDERRAFQFRVNPFGVQADAIFSQNEGVEDFSWDIIWSSAGRITEDGYIVEVAIPVNQIRLPRAAGEQTWGVELGRSYPRSVRHRISANPRSRNNTCVLCQVNKLTGFAGFEAGRNLEVDPTLTAVRSDKATTAGGPLEGGDQQIEPGVSVRWGVTPSTTINATVNPDFSQVEADAAQLSENERFALFFPEKRPFFLEGIDFFATPVNAVFTRTVADPSAGLKVTSKTGPHAVGLFVTRDEVNQLTIPSNQGSGFAFLDEQVTAAVGRYRRDIGADSTIGVLYAGREGAGYHNRVGGFDGFFRLSGADELRVQYLRSDTQYPGAISRDFGQSADAFAGDAIRVAYNHASRNWLWSAGYDDFDPRFRADSGFVPRVDVRTLNGSLARRFWGGPGDWLSNWSAGVNGFRTEDHRGQLTDDRVAATSSFSGPKQSFLNVTVERNAIFYRSRMHEDMLRAKVYFEMQPGAIGKVSLFVDAGETVDFANNQPADVFLVTPSVEMKLGRHVNMQLGNVTQQLDVAGGRLSRTSINQARLVYNFNVRTFVRAIVQHQDVSREPARYNFPVQARSESLFSQLLFSYKVNPQTVLFVGYSDNYFGVGDIDLSQTGRTFFVKLGYAWIL